MRTKALGNKHLMAVEMTMTQKTGEKGWRALDKKESLRAPFMGRQTPVRAIWRSLNKSETELPCELIIPLLGVPLNDAKSLSPRDIISPLFIAALSTTAKAWEQPNCPPRDEWMKKLWYIYTVEY